jgi:N4-gp56 family major capsid protein
MSDVTNKTTTTTLAATILTFYVRTLLENMEPWLVHYQFAKKVSFPKNTGKTCDFRRMTTFNPATTPITEGIIPDAHSLEMENVQKSIEQYGDVIKTTDLLEITSFDPLITEAIEMSGQQAARTIDILIRDEAAVGNNVRFSGTNSARYTLAPTDVLDGDDLRLTKRDLVNNNCPYMEGGNGKKKNPRAIFIAIISPHVLYDLEKDEVYLAAVKAQNIEALYYGEVSTWQGFRLVESQVAKKFFAWNTDAYSTDGKTANVLYELEMTVASWDNGTKTITIDEALSAAQAAALAGKEILVIDGDDDTEHYTTIVSATEGVEGAATLVIEDNAASLTITPTDGDEIIPGNAGKTALPVAATLCFGKDAYACINIQGIGDGNMGGVEVIVEPRTGGGPLNPLHQIATIGWITRAFAAMILYQERIYRIESGYTGSSTDTNPDIPINPLED